MGKKKTGRYRRSLDEGLKGTYARSFDGSKSQTSKAFIFRKLREKRTGRNLKLDTRVVARRRNAAVSSNRTFIKCFRRILSFLLFYFFFLLRSAFIVHVYFSSSTGFHYTFISSSLFRYYGFDSQAFLGICVLFK